MASPVLPSDALAVVPDASATLCGNFTKALLQLPVLFYKLINYLFDSSGNLTNAIISGIIPSGTVIQTAAAITDPNYLLCDGTVYPNASYPALAAVLGNLYGGSGGTFAVPDIRGRMVMSASGSHGLASTGGEDTHVLVADELPSEQLGIISNEAGNDGYFATDAGNGGTGPTGNFTRIGIVTHSAGGKKVLTDPLGSDDAHNNLPPYIVLFTYIHI